MKKEEANNVPVLAKTEEKTETTKCGLVRELFSILNWKFWIFQQIFSSNSKYCQATLTTTKQQIIEKRHQKRSTKKIKVECLWLFNSFLFFSSDYLNFTLSLASTSNLSLHRIHYYCFFFLSTFIRHWSLVTCLQLHKLVLASDYLKSPKLINCRREIKRFQ